VALVQGLVPQTSLYLETVGLDSDVKTKKGFTLLCTGLANEIELGERERSGRRANVLEIFH
jgi:hypothetical protein